MPLPTTNPEGPIFYPESSGESQLSDGLFSKGEYEKWVATINELFVYPSVITTLYASLLPPFMEILNCDNFTFDLGCETSTGKTTALKVAASCWGNPDFREESFARTWYQTSNAMEGCVSIISDLPFIVDDTKQAEIAMKAKDAHEMISSVLYMISSGKGKGSAKVDGMRTTSSFKTVMLTSGELSSVDMSRDGGTLARVLPLRGKPFGAVDLSTKLLVEDINDVVYENFGHAGPRVVQFILQHRDEWPLWKEAFKEACKRIVERSYDSPIAGRVSKNIAALTIIIPMVHAALPELNRDISVGDILGTIWNNVQASIAREDRPSDAVRLVYEWACQHQHLFWGRCPNENGICLTPLTEIRGHWYQESWEFIGFTSGCLKSILETEGFDFRQVINDWLNRDWLKCNASSQGNQIQVSMGQNKKNVYALKRSAIDQSLLQAGLNATGESD